MQGVALSALLINQLLHLLGIYIQCSFNYVLMWFTGEICNMLMLYNIEFLVVPKKVMFPVVF